MATSCLSKSHAVIVEKANTFSFGSSLSSLLVKKKNHMLACCHDNGSVRRANRPLQALNNCLNWKTDFICSVGTEPASILVDCSRGLGIVRFLEGKGLFITGATGFLAKALIEKILRTSPDVDKIYVLIRANNTEAAMDRLKSEIVNIELFSSLREIHGNDYQDFMLRKLIPVVGDAREAGMGIEATLSDEISEEVDVIVNSAANTTFDERYDVAMNINTIGPYRLMCFAQRFKRLKLFVQVSTAYKNGERQGRILEKPFCIGDTMARENNSSEFSAKTMPLVDIETEIKLAFASRNVTSDASLIQEMKDLGLARSKMHGWQDTYVFTKAMGEMVINSMRGDIPVVTIRPSVIESTFKEPFPGWIEGNRMMDPIVLYYGKGKLTSFLADPVGILDVIPADMVINATLAAMAKHGQGGDPGLHIYHIASSIENPLMFQDLVKSFYEHFSASPCIDSKGKPIVIPTFKLFTDTHKFSAHILSDMMQLSEREGNGASQQKTSQRQKNMLMKSVEQVKYLSTIYEPYTFYGGRFDNTNTQKLAMEMSDEEIRSFGFDVGCIDWDDYICNVHIPGIRRHVMKGRGMHTDS